MRKIVLYIAMSLDGYIAGKEGNVDWLSGDGSDPDNLGSYCEFIDTVQSPFRVVCRNFILPEICKPCLFLFAQFIILYRNAKSVFRTQRPSCTKQAEASCIAPACFSIIYLSSFFFLYTTRNTIRPITRTTPVMEPKNNGLLL